jgi:hypothetical protein
MTSDFDREMEAYISRRRQSGFLSGVARMFKRGAKPKLGPDVKTYNEESPEGKVKPMEQPAANPAPEPAMDEQKSAGWSFGGFLKGIFGPSAPAAPSESEFASPAPDESFRTDMKELCRITLDLAKQLPPAELKGFKESADFMKMKDILRKHKVIK